MGWTVRVHHHVRAASRVLPLEAAATAVAVFSFWWLVASSGDDLAARCFFSAVLAVPLFYGVSILRKTDRFPATVVRGLALLAAAVAVGVGARGTGHEEAFAWRFGLALLAAVMVPFVAAAASTPSGERRLGFTDFVRRFTQELTSSGLLWAAAMIAIAVLVVSIEGLFGIRRVAGVRLEDIGVDAAGAVTGLSALGMLHRLLPGGAPGRIPELWRLLVSRVAAPFLVAMLGILAVYEVWALGRGELPVNMLSPLIVAAGALGFASTLVIESLVAVRIERTLSPAEPHRWAATGPVRLSRAFAAILLVLLPLAVWALAIRIDQHGMTPLRAARMYALGCLGFLALWGAIRWIRRRGPLTWQVPTCVAIAALLAAVGPLSVVELSIRSQAARLADALDRAGVARSVRVDPGAVEIDAAVADEIAERIAILDDLGGARATSLAITGDIGPCDSRWRRDACLDHLGLVVRPSPGVPPRIAYVFAPPEADVAGFHSVEVSLRPGSVHTVGQDSLSLRGAQLVLDLADGAAAADLSPLLRGWIESRIVTGVPPLRDATGCVRGHLLARSAQVEETVGGPRLIGLDGVWLAPIDPGCD